MTAQVPGRRTRFEGLNREVYCVWAVGWSARAAERLGYGPVHGTLRSVTRQPVVGRAVFSHQKSKVDSIKTLFSFLAVFENRLVKPVPNSDPAL